MAMASTMKFTRRQSLRLAGATLAAAALPRFALAQTWPARPVRVIVPFAPGGTSDIFARLATQKLSEHFGRQFYVENVAGASGNLGTAQAAKAAPDGYTILIAFTSHVVNPSLFARVPYDAHKDFEAITLAVSSPTMLSVHPSVPAKTVKDLVALIKANPGKYNFASPGAGTPAHLAGEMFRLSLALDLVHIPYNGAGPAIASVVAGHSPFIFSTIAAALQQVRDGKLRALAITGKTRSRIVPDVPTMAEAGYPDIEGDNWVGVLVPAGTPKDIITTLHREIARIMTLPDMRERFTTLGFDVVASTPAEFDRRIKAEFETWGRVIRAANIKME